MQNRIKRLAKVLIFVKPDVIQFQTDYQPGDCEELIGIAESVGSIAVPIVGEGYWKIDNPLIKLLEDAKNL